MSADDSGPNEQVRALAIGGNEYPFHDFTELGPILEEFLSESGHVRPELTMDRDSLRREEIRPFDAVIDYTTDSTMTGEQRRGLLEFVDGGGGYVGIHCAADLTTGTDDPPEELRELIGGRFLGHPDQTDIDVDVVDTAHAITTDVEDFTVHDEPYELEHDDDLRILARMDHPELEDMPVAWTKRYGDGRVFYLSLGHDESAFTDETFQTLVTRGVRWAAGTLD